MALTICFITTFIITLGDIISAEPLCAIDSNNNTNDDEDTHLTRRRHRCSGRSTVVVNIGTAIVALHEPFVAVTANLDVDLFSTLDAERPVQRLGAVVAGHHKSTSFR
jgi:hypothetical protein